MKTKHSTIFSLAVIALMACGKPQPSLETVRYAYLQCDGDPRSSLGDFNLELQPTYNTGAYNLLIYPVVVARPGETVTVLAVNSTTLKYRELVLRTHLQARTTIYGGEITLDELNEYDVISIAIYQPAVDPILAQSQRHNICSMPVPGEGLNPYPRY